MAQGVAPAIGEIDAWGGTEFVGAEGEETPKLNSENDKGTMMQIISAHRATLG